MTYPNESHGKDETAEKQPTAVPSIQMKHGTGGRGYRGQAVLVPTEEVSTTLEAIDRETSEPTMIMNNQSKGVSIETALLAATTPTSVQGIPMLEGGTYRDTMNTIMTIAVNRITIVNKMVIIKNNGPIKTMVLSITETMLLFKSLIS